MKNNKLDIGLLFLIVLICVIFVGCAAAVKVENAKNIQEYSRMIKVEDAGVYEIYFDKYTNVMYAYTYRGGFTPIYNADGTLHLRGDDKTVG